MHPNEADFTQDGAEIVNFHGAHIMVYDYPADSKYIARKIANFKERMEDDALFAVVNLKVLLDRMEEWKINFSRAEPHYAFKCNNDPVIVRILANLGCGYDCASKDEIDYVLDNKLVPSEKIIYANTVKTQSFIKHASKIGINLMTFDNEEELYKIKKLHSDPKLLLRIYASDNYGQCSFGKKFGCDPDEEGPKLLQKAFELGIPVVGISFHIGIGFNDTQVICKAIKDARNLFEVGTKTGHKMTIFDIGGGFPGSDKMGKIPFKKISFDINQALDEHFPESMGVKIVSEPGRFFVASVVSVIVNIIAATKVKASRIFENPENPDEEAYLYYVNDGNFGSFSGRLFDNYTPKGEPLFIESGHEKEYPCIIYGPTCNGADKIEVKEKMRKMEVGEWLFYDDMGAYTKTISTNFNGFKQPKYFYFTDRETW
uniref:ornithine decarboxylase n=1 Tax=Acrobeloides nanus TaxID=290746 RepID=A0A914DPY4_9BILA